MPSDESQSNATLPASQKNGSGFGKSALKVSLILMAIFALYIGYGIFADNKARQDEQVFCVAVKVGLLFT